ASANTVTFSNALSARTPVTASATQLRVLVDRDATDGPVSVTTSGGTGKSAQSLTVTRGVGDVFVFAGTGRGNLLTLPSPTATTRYLVIPHSVNSNAPPTANYAYSIQSSALAMVANAATAAKTAPPMHVDANDWFEAQRWDNAEKLVQRY